MDLRKKVMSESETGRKIAPQRPPSWNCILRDYSAADGPI